MPPASKQNCIRVWVGYAVATPSVAQPPVQQRVQQWGRHKAVQGRI